MERDEYGGDFGVNPTLVVVTSSDLSKELYSFDFSNFSVYKYTKSGEHDFTKISVSNVVIDDNVLYANITHRTYSSSSSGYNAYLVAVDLETKGIKWVTKPLTCKANFIIDNDLIYTGYGFTKEEDYIYVIDKASGTRLHAVKVEKSPEYFAVKDGILASPTRKFKGRRVLANYCREEFNILCCPKAAHVFLNRQFMCIFKYWCHSCDLWKGFSSDQSQ